MEESRLMNPEEEQKLEEFFQNGEFLKPKDKIDEYPFICYLWENYRNTNEEFNTMHQRSLLEETNPDKVYIYTLIEEEGKAYIISGWHFVNRFAYLFSKKNISTDDTIRFW